MCDADAKKHELPMAHWLYMALIRYDLVRTVSLSVDYISFSGFEIHDGVATF